jgi:hypothetical protein
MANQKNLPGMDRTPSRDHAHGYAGLPYNPGSPTAKAAAESMVEKAKNMRQRAWEFIHERGGYGATIDEVNAGMGILNSCATRVTELRRLGRIEATGFTRKTRSGRRAEIYVTVRPEDWTDKRPGWPCPPRPRSRRHAPQWTHVETMMPPEGTWCWVSDGDRVLLARPDKLAAGGWTNEDTWEDFTGGVRWWIAITKPEPPREGDGDE